VGSPRGRAPQSDRQADGDDHQPDEDRRPLLGAELVGTLTAEPELVGETAHHGEDRSDGHDGPSHESARTFVHETPPWT
jgi:hypothetical protein